MPSRQMKMMVSSLINKAMDACSKSPAPDEINSTPRQPCLAHGRRLVDAGIADASTWSVQHPRQTEHNCRPTHLSAAFPPSIKQLSFCVVLRLHLHCPGETNLADRAGARGCPLKPCSLSIWGCEMANQEQTVIPRPAPLNLRA